MSTALEDPRHGVDTDLQGGTDEGPEEHLGSVFIWWAIVMVIAVGSVVLNFAHRS